MTNQNLLPEGLELRAALRPGYETIITREALEFLAGLQRKFDGRRRELLERRRQIQARLTAGQLPDFLDETLAVRRGDWRVGTIPRDLLDRRVEITGPTERKTLINALNSGARVFMADFEDANSPTWDNLVQGQINLVEAINGTISLAAPEGKEYRLHDKTAVLVVRPRGWHLPEKHLLVDGEPLSGALFDFGLYFFHNAKKLTAQGTGPYFYLPKLENHLEARLWNDVFVYAQERLGLRKGTIKATVLIETILAAFEMEEILYELRDHVVALNAGRWDYLFSIIKKFHQRSDLHLPDRACLTMSVPFMRAYTELLVQTCHKRGAMAIGGMAAFIPSRKDPQANEIALKKVREDKRRESGDGFDGAWVAHPDLVPVVLAVFDSVLCTIPNQIGRLRDDVRIDAMQLADFEVPDGKITEAGLRGNVSVAILYLESWLRGVGAAGINNLMEDTATAEISRAQVWQWLRAGELLDDERQITGELVRTVIREELAQIETAAGGEKYREGKFQLAAEIFEQLTTSREFADFLTLVAYQHLD